MGVERSYAKFDLSSVINPKTLILSLSLGACICFLILFLIGVPSNYVLLYMEPIVYLLFLNLFIRPRFVLGIGCIILLSMYFVKLCIIPITTVLGNFTSTVSSAIYDLYWNEACVYIAIEWFIVSLSIRISGNHYLNKREGEKVTSTKSILSWRTYPIYYIAMVGFIGILLILIALNHDLLNALSFIWQLEDGSPGENGGPIWFMFKNFIEWTKPMFLFWLTVKVYNSKLKQGKFFLLLVIAFISSIIMTDYRILSLITGITILGFILTKYGRFKFLINFVKIICVTLFTLAVYQLTTHGEELNQTFANLGRLMDVYCGGYIVAAASCSVHMNNGFLMFINDTVSGNPLSHVLFGTISTTADVINSALNYEAKGTFYELMVQAKDFFGILSPIAVALCVFFLMKMDFCTITEDVDLYRIFYIFCSACVGFFMVMYTYSMVTNFIIYKCLVWIIIIAVDRHIRVKC